MTEREQKLAIVENMVNNGYHLCGRTIDQLADMMSLEDWRESEKKFLARG